MARATTKRSIGHSHTVQPHHRRPPPNVVPRGDPTRPRTPSPRPTRTIARRVADGPADPRRRSWRNHLGGITTVPRLPAFPPTRPRRRPRGRQGGGSSGPGCHDRADDRRTTPTAERARPHEYSVPDRTTRPTTSQRRDDQSARPARDAARTDDTHHAGERRGTTARHDTTPTPHVDPPPPRPAPPVRPSRLPPHTEPHPLTTAPPPADRSDELRPTPARSDRTHGGARCGSHAQHQSHRDESGGPRPAGPARTRARVNQDGATPPARRHETPDHRPGHPPLIPPARPVDPTHGRTEGTQAPAAARGAADTSRPRRVIATESPSHPRLMATGRTGDAVNEADRARHQVRQRERSSRGASRESISRARSGIPTLLHPGPAERQEAHPHRHIAGEGSARHGGGARHRRSRPRAPPYDPDRGTEAGRDGSPTPGAPRGGT